METETCEGCGLPKHDGVCLDHAVDECNRLRAELAEWREAYEDQREELIVRRSRLQIPLADPDDVKPDQVVVDPANKRVYVSVWMQDSCLIDYLREEYIVDKNLREAEFPFDSNECKLSDGWSVIRVSAAMFVGARAELTEWSRLAKMNVSEAYKKWVGACSECGADGDLDECHKHFCEIGMAESQEASDIDAAKLAEARAALRAALNWLDLPAGGEAIYTRKDLPVCVRRLRALLPPGTTEGSGLYPVTPVSCQHSNPACPECTSVAFDMAKAACRKPPEGDGTQWRLVGGEPLSEDVRVAMYWQCRCGHTVAIDASAGNPLPVPDAEKAMHEAECAWIEGGNLGEG